MNIYDFAGNVFEWTLEKTSNQNRLCVDRGSSYNYSGATGPAYCRSDDTTITNSHSIGFRSIFYAN